MVKNRSDGSRSGAASKKRKGRRLEETPEKPPAIQQRRKSRLSGGGATSNDSSPSVLENLLLVANRRRATGEINNENRMNDNVDDEDILPRGRMDRETNRDYMINSDASDDDVLPRRTNRRNNNRMNDDEGDADELARGMVSQETNRRGNRIDDNGGRTGVPRGLVLGGRETNIRHENEDGDEEVIPRGSVSCRANNKGQDNRTIENEGDDEVVLRRRGRTVSRETNRWDNRMNSNVDDGSSDGDDSNVFEQGIIPATSARATIVDRQSAMGGRRQNVQEIDLMLHKKTAKSKYVVDRVQGFVKNHLFRKVKFITKQKMLDEVMEVVEETEEGVTDNDIKRMAFRKLYQSSVMEALNARRSSCDQMGCKIVQRYLSQTWLPNPVAGGEEADEGIPSFLSIETLSKLRRAETEEERKAFVWFFAEFMDCVCGKRAWGKQKYTQRISDASSLDNPNEKLLTVSDEAFGLLLVENYMEKWVKKFHIQRKGLPLGRLDGVYTSATKGNLVFGGWTKQGRSRFNYYCRLVQEDRSSDRSAHVENEFLVTMQKTPEGIKIQDRLLKRAARVSKNDDDESEEEDIYYEKLVHSHQ